jgi:hypothetical protein
MLRISEKWLPELQSLPPFTKAFSSLYVGLLLLVVGYSAVVTEGGTVQILQVPVILTFLFVVGSPKAGVNNMNNSPQSTHRFLFLCASAVFVWCALQAFHWGTFPYQIPFRDDRYYGSIALALNKTGVEGIAGPDALISAENYTIRTPYHYFELWLTAALARSGWVPAVHVLLVPVRVVLALAAVAGSCAILELQGQSSAKSRLMAMLFLFFAPVAPYAGSNNLLLRDATLFSEWGMLLGQTKLFVVYLWAIAAIVGFLRSASVLALVLLGGAGVASAAALPATVASLLAAAVIRWRQESSRSAPTVALLLLLFLLLGLGGFYSTQPSFGPTVPGEDTFVTSLLSLDAWRTRLNILIKTPLQVFAVFLPTIAVIIHSRGWPRGLWQAAWLPVTGSLCGAVVSGLFAWMLTYATHDSVQLFAVPCLVALNSLILCWWTATPQRSRRLDSWLLALVAIATWDWAHKVEQPLRSLPYDESFLAELDSVQPQGQQGGFFLSKETLETASVFERTLRVYTPGYVGIVRCCTAAAGLTDVVSDDKRNPASRRLIQDQVFQRFLKENPRLKGDPDEARRLFAERHRLRFIVVPRGEKIPVWPKQSAARQVVDPRSGETVLFLP